MRSRLTSIILAVPVLVPESDPTKASAMHHDDDVSRRVFLERLAAGALLGAADACTRPVLAQSGSGGWTPPPVLKNPNILIIMVDQMRPPMWMNSSQLATLQTVLPNIMGVIQNNSYNFEQFFVSATECTASASIDADPVSRNATNFATAMPRLAANAANTAFISRNVPAPDVGQRRRCSVGRQRGLLGPRLEVADRRGLAWVDAGRDGQVDTRVVGQLDDAG